MDENERKRKLEAGKVKFNQYRKKREGLKNIGDEEKKDRRNCQSLNSAITTSTSSDYSAVADFHTDMFASTDESMDENEDNTDVPENAGGISNSSSELQIESKEELYSTSDRSSYQVTLTLDSEVDVLQLNGDIREKFIKESSIKLAEYEAALKRRDVHINELTEKLTAVLARCDGAANQEILLSKDIETLKLQLRNASEILKNNGAHGVLAAELLEAKNQIIALNQKCAENTYIIEDLGSQNGHLNTNLGRLQSELRVHATARSEIEKQWKEDISRIQLENGQLRESVQEMTIKNDEITTLLHSKEDTILGFLNDLQKSSQTRNDVETGISELRNRELVLNEELKLLRDYCESREEVFKQNETETKIYIDKLQLELETLKSVSDTNNAKSTQEIQNLTEQLDDLQHKLSEWPLRMSQEHANHEIQIETVKREMEMTREFELNKLKEEILTLNLEREHLQIKMTEAESFDSQASVVEELKLEIQEKNLAINQFSEKNKMLEYNILEYSKDCDELKIKLDQFVSEKIEIMANLSAAENVIKQLQLENSELTSRELIFNDEKKNLTEALESKNRSVIDLEKNLTSITSELFIQKQTHDELLSEKMKILETLSSKDDDLRKLETDVMDLKAVLISEKQLVDQINGEFDAAQKDLVMTQSNLSLQSEQVSSLRSLLDQLEADKTTTEDKLRAHESKLEQLERENDDLRREKQTLEVSKTEIELHLSEINKIIETVKFKNSELEATKTELESEKILLKDFKAQFQEVNKQHAILKIESDDQMKRLEEMKILLSNTIDEKEHVLLECNELRTELTKLKENGVEDFLNLKEKFDQLLQEKVELEISLQTSDVDTGITRETSYLCGSEVGIDSIVPDDELIKDIGNEKLITKSKTVQNVDGRIEKLLQIVGVLLSTVEIGEQCDFQLVIRELREMEKHLQNLISVENLQKELEIVVQKQENEAIQVKQFTPLYSEIVASENLDELKAALDKANNEKLEVLAECKKLKAALETLTGNDNDISKKRGVDMVSVEVQVDMDDQDNLKLKYDKLLQEKVELEIELQTSTIDATVTKEKAYLCGSDGHQQGSTLIESKICNTDEFIKLLDNFLNELEKGENVDYRHVVEELKTFRESFVRIASVSEPEFEKEVNREVKKNVEVQANVSEDNWNLTIEIENLRTQLEVVNKEKCEVLARYNELERRKMTEKNIVNTSTAEVQVDFDDSVNWKQMYDEVLQEKMELEIESQTIDIRHDSDIKFQKCETESDGQELISADSFKLTSAKSESGLVKLVDWLLNKVQKEEFDVEVFVLTLRDLRKQIISAVDIDNLQLELENAVEREETQRIKVKKYQPLGDSHLDGVLSENFEAGTEKLNKVIAKNNDVQREFQQLTENDGGGTKKEPIANNAEVQTHPDEQVNWEEKYNQLLREKVELESELQTSCSDTGLSRKEAYLCSESTAPEVKSSNQRDLVDGASVQYESYMDKLVKTFDELDRIKIQGNFELETVVRELHGLREFLVNTNTVYRQEIKYLPAKKVDHLGIDDVHSDTRPLEDTICCECIETVSGSDKKTFLNESQVESEDESLKLRKKIAHLENQLAEKDNDLVRTRQELQTQYEEDVENVRQSLQTSLAEEVQADVEAEVDELKEKVDADIRARNVENGRLCNALQELKVQVQQLQRDKLKLERSLNCDEMVHLDDIQMDFDDPQNSFLALDSLSRGDKWEAMSENSDDSKLSSSQARKHLIYLLGVYVNISKTVNMELINLIGTDLGVCDATLAADKSVQYPDWMGTEDASDAETSFLTNATEDGGTDVYENLVLETGSKLNTAVQRLLGMLSALVQQLQETHRSPNAINDDSQALFEESSEDLVAQLTVEARTKEFLGAELNKTADLLKAAEAEKLNLKEDLVRKEKHLAELICQLEETKTQSQKLEECLTEGDLLSPFQQEFITEGLGEGGQILRFIPVESKSGQLAAGDTELLDENARLQREKRGLQHRVERERSELTARIRELERILEETTAAQDFQIEAKRQEVADLQQQIDAIEKQLRGYKNFIEEQTLEREQEREDYQREINKLQDIAREKDRAQNSEERLSREVETWQEQLKEKNQYYKQLFEKKEQLEKELENLLEKSNSDQDVIRDLERQLDCKSQNEKILTERIELIQSELSQTSRVHHDQSLEIEQLRKVSVSSPLSVSTMFFEEYFGRGQTDCLPSPQSVVLELRSQVHNLEEKVSRHSVDLEGLLVVSSCLSSPCSEEVSVREQLESIRNKEKESNSKNESIEPSFGAFIKDISRLEDKVESLSRSKDIVLKKLKDYEAQLVKQRRVEEELLQDRDMLQQKVNAHLLQITSLQAKIEKRRFGLEDDEVTERLAVLEVELDKERQLVICKTKKIEELQYNLTEMEQHCTAYKKQLNDLMQRYNGDVNMHKKAQSTASAELNETKQNSEILKTDLLKTQKQLEDVSSLLQSIMTEKNKEIDIMSSDLQVSKTDNDELKRTVESLELKVLNANVAQEQLSAANESVQKLTNDIQEKDVKFNETEREWKKCLEIVEQKRREVEALKVVLEEKAQLVEQVSTLRAELVNLSQYQARLQEDFDLLQAMLEERHVELAVAHQEVTELNLFKTMAGEEKVHLQSEIETLQERLKVSATDSKVQIDTMLEEKEKMEAQNLKIQSLQLELNNLLADKETLSEKFKSEEKKVKSLNKKLKLTKVKLEDYEENVKMLTAELDKSNTDLKQAKDELNSTLQLKSRLEAEISLRDAKIFRIEDELEQLKTTRNEGDGNKGKASLYKFLEEVRQDVLRENDSLTYNERVEDSSDGYNESFKTSDVNKRYLRDDVRHGNASPGASVSSSDVDSVTSEPLPVPVKSLMKKVYKEGIHVLNLSELSAVEDNIPTDAPLEDFNRTMKHKNWENEKVHLIAEIEALKELLTHVTNVATLSRSSEAHHSTIPDLLQSILKLLSKDRTVILERLFENTKNTNTNNDRLEKCVSEMIEMYNHLSHSIQNLILNLKQGSSAQSDSNSMTWEIQMAVAKERLLNQTEQKKLLGQLQTLDQQLGLRERQLKRQSELLEFRVQQEQLISEDLRRGLELEKTRCIELCSQLALEKGRATHLDLSITQLKSELASYQMAIDQEKQELYSTMKQLKNEKATVESFVQILQTERENFIQLQEAMEAEKRRSKSSCQRNQQIKEELRQALITERDRQLELTTLLETERLALQSARQDLLRAQNKSNELQTEKHLSSRSSVEDTQSILTLEKIKSQDLAASLQKEQHKVAVLTAALQQDRKQLLDELDGAKESCTRMQSKLENYEVQKVNLMKEVQRNREEVHRLELECDRLCNELSTTQNNVYQKDQEVEQLRRIQREMNKDLNIERELERQKLQEMKLDNSKLKQKVSSLEKEQELAKRSENLIESTDFGSVQQPNRKHSIQSLRSDPGLSRTQLISLEAQRQKLALFLIKFREKVAKYLQVNWVSEEKFDKFSSCVKSMLGELDIYGQELQLPQQNEDGLSVHLELMEKVVRHNAELAEFALRLSEEKLVLRDSLMREKNELDSLKWTQGAAGGHLMSSSTNILSAERASWAQERTRLQQALHKAEANLARGSSSRQSRVTSPASIDQIDDAKTIWQKYLRAESFRKNLVFQKTYLLLVLAGYQYTESGTLEVLNRLGCISSPRPNVHSEYRHSRAFQRFRSAARLIFAIFRMKFLVRRWHRSCKTPIYENSHDRFSTTSSIIYTPSVHSQSNRFSYNSGYTPPVKDVSKHHFVDEGSSAKRSLPFASISSSSGSSNVSLNGGLSEYVRRFHTIQQQLGIVIRDSNTEK